MECPVTLESNDGRHKPGFPLAGQAGCVCAVSSAR